MWRSGEAAAHPHIRASLDAPTRCWGPDRKQGRLDQRHDRFLSWLSWAPCIGGVGPGHLRGIPDDPATAATRRLVFVPSRIRSNHVRSAAAPSDSRRRRRMSRSSTTPCFERLRSAYRAGPRPLPCRRVGTKRPRCWIDLPLGQRRTFGAVLATVRTVRPAGFGRCRSVSNRRVMGLRRRAAFEAFLEAVGGAGWRVAAGAPVRRRAGICVSEPVARESRRPACP